MSKKINVNPDHYKVAGRERQGEDIPADREKRVLSQAKAGARGTPPNRKVPPVAQRQPRKKK